MPIKPTTVLGLSRATLAREEEILLSRLESEIDEFLRLNFERDFCPYFILTEHLSLAAMHELLRRYRRAGWNVVAWPNGRTGSTLLYFIQGKQRAPEGTRLLPGTH
jgi:hypothetical protein